MRRLIPSMFHMVEKAWNYYPFTVTGTCVCCASQLTHTQSTRYGGCNLHNVHASHPQCSFLPRFVIKVRTVYENNKGDSNDVCCAIVAPHCIIITGHRQAAEPRGGGAGACCGLLAGAHNSST